MFLFRLIAGLVLVGGGGLIAVSDIWRLNNPASCDAAQLCTTFAAKTPTEVSVQIWITLVFTLFGIIVLSRARGGRIGTGVWAAVALIPSMLLDLGYHLLMAANITGLVQLGDRNDLSFNIVFDVMMLGFAVVLLAVDKYFVKPAHEDRAKSQSRTAESERKGRNTNGG